ncbi:MAG: helix-turn-helix transcriptional regulator [Cyclobacteriaceae bacterium]
MNQLTGDLPTWVPMAKVKMKEQNLTQILLAEKLNIPQSRVSEYLTGKREPTLEIARRIHKFLGINGDIMLR